MLSKYMDYLKQLPKRAVPAIHNLGQHYVTPVMETLSPENIQSYVDIIRSFKYYEFSYLIKQIATQLHDALNGPRFNPRIAPYLQKRKNSSVPYTQFELEPANISQLKKIINALYFGHLALRALEQIHLDGVCQQTMREIYAIVGTIKHNIYQALDLITHLDVGLNEFLGEELSVLAPLIETLESLITKGIPHATKTDAPPLGYRLGVLSGMTINCMNPSTDHSNDKLLGQLGSDLPGYIDKLTLCVSQFLSPILLNESSSTKERLKTIQTEALKLLHDLEYLKANRLQRSLKIIQYAHSVRTLVTLSIDFLEHMGPLSNSAEVIILKKLSQLKYIHLAQLFFLVDRIEDQFMLKPGLLSQPLMKKIKPLYALFIHYAMKRIDFQKNGEDLISIDDTRFMDMRVKQIQKRIDKGNKFLFKIQKARDAFHEFFAILSAPKIKNQPIHLLPLLIREQLSEYYTFFSAFVGEMDFSLNEMLISSLNGAPNLIGTHSWSSLTNRMIERVKKPRTYLDDILRLLEMKDKINCCILKKEATARFQQQLSQDLIHSIQQETEFSLAPHDAKNNVFFIDEAQALNIQNSTTCTLKYVHDKHNKMLQNPEHLTSDQALSLFFCYQNKLTQLISAKEGLAIFLCFLKEHMHHKEMLLDLASMDEESKVRCKSLYHRIQAYVTEGVRPEMAYAAKMFDAYIVHSLTPKHPLVPIPNLLADEAPYLEQHLNDIERLWINKSQAYFHQAQKALAQEHKAIKLKFNTDETLRAHHLIPHTHVSEFLKAFRATLFQIVGLFNQSMSRELQANPVDLPFPELEHTPQMMSGNKQAWAIKRLFNGAYHLLHIAIQLEALRHDQYEINYVRHLLEAYKHIHELIKLIHNLTLDPHFSLMIHELAEKAQTLWANIQEHSDPYQVRRDEVCPRQTLRCSALWYSLNAFFILPHHLRAINNHSYLLVDELDGLHRHAKQSALRIEGIIQASDSYFKLFLETPNMYRLYRDLTNKLNEFTSTAHEAVVEHLDHIQSMIITPMLVEADHWEDKLCLKPGLFSGPLKKMTDEYLHGLIHSFHLPSKNHMDLVHDKTPFVQRIQITHKKIDQAEQKIKHVKAQYSAILAFYELIKEQGYLEESIDLTSHQSNPCQKQIHTHYSKALPKLVKLHKKLALTLNPNDQDLYLDSICNASLKKYEPKFNQIYALTKAAYHHYLGIVASYQMEIDTAQEKLAYLMELNSSQEKINRLYTEQYTHECYHKHMTRLCNHPIGLTYTDKEYRTKLQNFLNTSKDAIVNTAITKTDIHHEVIDALTKKNSFFEKKFLKQHQQMDAIRSALDEFKKYLCRATRDVEQNHAYFENEHTLYKKTKYILTLKEIAENELIPIKTRLCMLQKEVRHPHFERDMLAQKSENHISFTYLIQCITALLEALHLYTPVHKKTYMHLKERCLDFGFFATSKKINTNHRLYEQAPALEKTLCG